MNRGRLPFVMAVAVAIAVAAPILAGCGRGFDVKTAPGFVPIKDDNQAYDWRAVVPEGVAVAVRAVPAEDKTDVAFWERAVLLRTRELDGYALLHAADVRSADGTPGRELVFGHDEHGKPYVYRVRLLVRGSKLVVAEAGGAKDVMDKWQPSVDWMLASLRVD